jgi:cell division protein FtsQ
VAARALGIVALAGATVWGIDRVVNASPGLRVGHVVVTGNAHLSTGEVLSRLDGVVGSSLLTLDLEACRASLRSSPWVADVTMRRVLPDTLEVSVTERRPLAIARTGAALVLVDAEGAVIDEFGPNYEGFDLPIIDGLAQAATASDAAGDGAHARVTARLLTDLSGDEPLLRRVSQVDVTDPQNVVVWLQDDTTRLLVGDREFRKRLTSYVEVREALRARVPEIDAVDLRFDRRLFVRPAQERPAGQARPASGPQTRTPS